MRTLYQVVSVALFGLVILALPGCNHAPPQAKFATPEDAAAALHAALKSGNLQRMKALFGREWVAAVASGDEVSDHHEREVVALAMDQSWHWAPRGDNARELIIGDEQWPFPISLVKSGKQWQFDSGTGKEEVLARRIGGNELAVIKLCRDYVRAQKEYASQSHDGQPPGSFAQRFRSSPGRQDGLFWGRKRWEKRSPLDELVTAAVAEGYDPDRPGASPFQGYRFRILTAQGPAAQGGKKSYLANGDLAGGFALLAYPAKYSVSGIMTFVVGQDGVVYQKDLGKDTDAEAARLMDYNPDESWTAVQSP